MSTSSLADDEVQRVEALAQLAGLGVAQPDAVADREVGVAEHRRLDLAGALAAVEAQAGRVARATAAGACRRGRDAM